eukprot:2581674-Amphidinium_carterae.1
MIDPDSLHPPSHDGGGDIWDEDMFQRGLPRSTTQRSQEEEPDHAPKRVKIDPIPSFSAANASGSGHQRYDMPSPPIPNTPSGTPRSTTGAETPHSVASTHDYGTAVDDTASVPETIDYGQEPHQALKSCLKQPKSQYAALPMSSDII